jgi:ABC-type lipoprotein release transport system permease subunit
MLIWKIAWRNVWRHKGKSLVIGGILCLGAFLMTVGNAVIEGAKEGMAENMVNRFTGHLVLTAADETNDAVLLSPRTALKVIPDYPGVKTVLEEQEFLERFVPMMRGMATILNPDGKQGATLVFGVNFGDYQETFLHNIVPIEGELLQNGERGLLISEATREEIYDRQKFWVVPEGLTVEQTPAFREPQPQKGQENRETDVLTDVRQEAAQGTLRTSHELIIMGFSANSFGSDIRVPVKGIIEFQSLNNIWQTMSFLDIESYRESFGYITAANNAIELSEQQAAVFHADPTALDDLFGSGAIVEHTDIQTETYDLSTLQVQTERTAEAVDTDLGAYNLVSLKLRPGQDMLEAQTRLQRVLDQAGAQVTVITWEDAIGGMAQFSAITQGALVLFVIFIFFVAIIVIMNTLSMAALERIGEIGMMRAVGAQKRFVSQMFLSETCILSFFFGGAGIVAGIAAVLLIAAIGISVTSNTLLSLLFGGDTFHPLITGGNLVSGIMQLGAVTLLAVAYPLLIARKITPLEAISRD